MSQTMEGLPKNGIKVELLRVEVYDSRSAIESY